MLGKEAMHNLFTLINKVPKVLSYRRRDIDNLSRTIACKIKSELWLKELVPALKNTEDPIAIIVGTSIWQNRINTIF